MVNVRFVNGMSNSLLEWLEAAPSGTEVSWITCDADKFCYEKSKDGTWGRLDYLTKELNNILSDEDPEEIGLTMNIRNAIHLSINRVHNYYTNGIALSVLGADTDFATVSEIFKCSLNQAAECENLDLSTCILFIEFSHLLKEQDVYYTIKLCKEHNIKHIVLEMDGDCAPILVY